MVAFFVHVKWTADFIVHGSVYFVLSCTQQVTWWARYIIHAEVFFCQATGIEQ